MMIWPSEGFTSLFPSWRDGEEDESRDMGGGRTVRSLYPDEVTVSVSDEEETTRRLEGSVVVED